MFKKINFIVFVILINNLAIAQKSNNKSKNLIQFSGVVVESDSLRAIPYTSIIVKNNNRGTISDFFGYYSFVAQKNDTVEFTAIGYSSAQYVIPDSLSSYTYSLIQVLKKDTIYLQTTVVYPWPTKEQFKHAFLSLDMTDYGLEIATNNINRNQMVEMATDASLSYKYANQQYQSKLYYAGQYPSNNLLNPDAWAKFIKACKNGSYKQ